MQNVILRTLRAAKGYPQDTLADMLDMSQPNYSDIECGKTKINSNIAQKLADIFETTPELFLTEKPIVFNHNFSNNSKGIINADTYNESEKETITAMLQKIDSLFIQLQQEREAVNAERKQVLELMGKLLK